MAAENVKKLHIAGNLQGKDGYTPVKGVDYFTEADKQDIAKEAAELVSLDNLEGRIEKLETIKKLVSTDFEDDASDFVAADGGTKVYRGPSEIHSSAYISLTERWNQWSSLVYHNVGLIKKSGEVAYRIEFDWCAMPTGEGNSKAGEDGLVRCHAYFKDANDVGHDIVAERVEPNIWHSFSTIFRSSVEISNAKLVFDTVGKGDYTLVETFSNEMAWADGLLQDVERLIQGSYLDPEAGNQYLVFVVEAREGDESKGLFYCTDNDWSFAHEVEVVKGDPTKTGIYTIVMPVADFVKELTDAGLTLSSTMVLHGKGIATFLEARLYTYNPTIPNEPLTSDWSLAPDFSIDNVKVTEIIDKPIPLSVDNLVSVTTADNGKVLQVQDGKWAANEIPAATDEEVMEMLIGLDMLPAVTSEGSVLTDENGDILLW